MSTDHTMNDDLSIGSVEQPALAVATLCERMDKVCALMSFQAEQISYAETAVEQAKYNYKKAAALTKKRISEEVIKLKQEDRSLTKDKRRTEKEYESLSIIAADGHIQAELLAERDMLHANHKLSEENAKYDTLNNRFLSYRKACDLLNTEMQTFQRSNAHNNHLQRPGG